LCLKDIGESKMLDRSYGQIGTALLVQSKKPFLLVFYGILLVELLAIQHHTSIDFFMLLMAGCLFLLTLFKPFWGLCLFVAAVPLLNGMSVLYGVKETSFAFTVVYLAWFPRYLLNRKSSQPETTISLLTYLLSIIVLLNLCLVVFRVVEWPIPSKFWLEWASSFPSFTQAEPLWQVNAALILLKGLVLFQMVELEITGHKKWVIFSRTIYVQAICVAGFALFHWVDLKTSGAVYTGLSLPFNDIHSYGSVVALFFMIFVVLFLSKFDQERDNKRKPDGRKASYWKTVQYGVFVFVFFLLCLYSSSRITWLVSGTLVLVVLVQTIKNKKVIIGAITVLIVLFGIASLFIPTLLKSDNAGLYRLGTLLNVKDLAGDRNLIARYDLWDRSLTMVLEYPLTGVGVGNVYRNIQFYKSSKERLLDTENSHNYYLQFAAELGVPSLILFLFILLSLYSSLGGVTQRRKQAFPKGIFLRPFRYGLGAYLLTMLTGHPLLLVSQQFLFWPIVAIISKGQYLQEDIQYTSGIRTKAFKIIGISIFFLYVVGFCSNIYKRDPWTIPVTYGFYSLENWNGINMRWISGKAEYYLPAERKELIISVVALPFNSQKPKGLTLTISINNAVVDRVHFLNGGKKILSYSVSSIKGSDIKVNFEVDRVFSPLRIGLSQDSRLLGIAIGELNRLPMVPAIPCLLIP